MQLTEPEPEPVDALDEHWKVPIHEAEEELDYQELQDMPWAVDIGAAVIMLVTTIAAVWLFFY